MNNKMDYRLWCWIFFVLFLIMFFVSAFLAKAWGDELQAKRIAIEEIDNSLWDCMRVRDFYKSDLDEMKARPWDKCEENLMECVHQREYYEGKLEAIPAYCSAGLYEVTIDGLEARVRYLEGQINSCTRAYLVERKVESWLTLALVKQALCDADSNCSNCVVMTEGRYDWCFDYAYYP